MVGPEQLDLIDKYLRQREEMTEEEKRRFETAYESDEDFRATVERQRVLLEVFKLSTEEKHNRDVTALRAEFENDEELQGKVEREIRQGRRRDQFRTIASLAAVLLLGLIIGNRWTFFNSASEANRLAEEANPTTATEEPLVGAGPALARKTIAFTQLTLAVDGPVSRQPGDSVDLYFYYDPRAEVRFSLRGDRLELHGRTVEEVVTSDFELLIYHRQGEPATELWLRRDEKYYPLRTGGMFGILEASTSGPPNFER